MLGSLALSIRRDEGGFVMCLSRCKLAWTTAALAVVASLTSYVIAVGVSLADITESVRGQSLTRLLEAMGRADSQVVLQPEQCQDELRSGVILAARDRFGDAKWEVLEVRWTDGLSKTYVWLFRVGEAWVVDSGCKVGFLVHI